MFSKYYPTSTDYQKVIKWLASEGLNLTQGDTNHLGISVSGKVTEIQRAFRVSFGKLLLGNYSYVSAITAPNIPESLDQSF